MSPLSPINRVLKWLFPHRGEALSFVIVLLLTLLITFGFAGCLAYYAYQARTEATAWREAHREDRILGKTSEVVKLLFGEPGVMLKDRDGTIESIIYYGPWGAGIMIHFKNDVATEVEEYVYK